MKFNYRKICGYYMLPTSLFILLPLYVCLLSSNFSFAQTVNSSPWQVNGWNIETPAIQTGIRTVCKSPQITGIIKDDFLVNDDTSACTGSNQRHSAIATDELGNFVIVWHDDRNGDADIYGQRYNSNGDTIGLNFRINEDAGSEIHWYPAAVMKDSGDFVVVWGDKRSGEWDIYGQRYDAFGQPLSHNFKVNDDATFEWQKFPAITLNHAGDFVIVWQDERNGYREIYCQRYDSNGDSLGANFRIDGKTGYAWQLHPAIAMDSLGNFVVVWMDCTSGDWDIWARMFDYNGVPLDSSFKVNDNMGVTDQEWPSAAMDNNGNFVLTWRDERYGNGDGDIYGQMYNSSGTPIGANFPINTGSGNAWQWPFAIGMDPSGNFTVAWHDNRYGNYDIWAQRYNELGNAIGNNFKVNDDTGANTQYSPACAVDEAGNIFITWFDDRTGDDDIYVQRYDSSGGTMGPNFRANDNKGMAMQEWTSITMDPSGGFVITWTDRRNDPGDIYGQRYNASGDTLGSNFRINTDSVGNWQHYSLVAIDSSGNFVVVWEDLRNMRPDVYCQRFNASGTPTGPNFRVNEDTTMGMYIPASPSVSMIPSGEFVVVWIHAGMADPEVWGQRYDASGNALGGNIKVNDDAPGALQYFPSVAVDNSFNFVVVWEDGRNGHADIYAQRYDSNGDTLGSNFRVNLDNGTTHQYQASVMMNSAGDFVVMWQDQRNGLLDIYAQRYDASGNALGSNFIVNDDTPGSSLHYYPSGAVDDSGRYVIVWTDFRNPDGDVLAQKYYADGTPWGSNVRINSDSIYYNHQWANLRSVATNAGILAFTWMDNRGREGWDIYAKVTDWDIIGVQEAQNVAVGFALHCYPNPFSKIAHVKFQIPHSKYQGKGQKEKGKSIELKIYDATGRLVRRFDYPTMRQSNQFIWNGADEYGHQVPAGVYFVQLQTQEKSITEKIIRIE